MIYGDQWVCLCGWHNVFLRRSCRNCHAPRAVATVETETAGEVVQRRYEDSLPREIADDG